MIDNYDIIFLILLGGLGSFISGYLGVGGGIVYVPILDYFLSKLGFQNDELVKAILANSLFTIIFSGIIASYKQYKMNNFYPKEVSYTAVTGVASVLVMTWLIGIGSWYSKILFNYVFASMMLIVLARMFLVNKVQHATDVAVSKKSYAITGFITGLTTALSGLGGGVVMTPIISEILRQPFKKASSISNGVIPFLAFTVGVFNLTQKPNLNIHPWQFGYIIFPIVLPMILASFIFAPLGVRASHASNPKLTRIIFSSLIAIILTKLIYEIYKTYTLPH
jgi:uncharacterized membrane protein YfcA